MSVNTPGWLTDQLILKDLTTLLNDVSEVQSSQAKLEKSVDDLKKLIPTDNKDLENKLNQLTDVVKQQGDASKLCCQMLNNKLDQLQDDITKLLKYLIPPPPGPPASFTVSIS